MITLGKRIKMLRRREGITQKELANALGVGASTITMYETDKRVPNNDMFVKLADYFGVDVDYLLGRSDVASSITNADDLENRVEVVQSIAERLLKNPEYISLFQYAAKLSPEDVDLAIMLLKRMVAEPIEQA